MNRLAVFARAPVVGAVKTRLSPALPSPVALDLYLGLLADALEVARGAATGPVTLYWHGAPPPAAAALGREVAQRRQCGAGLGERLAAATAELLTEPGDRVAVIGADCPDLHPDLVRSAFHALEDHPVVLGPARDGGYYLIGLARPAPALFRGVPWGTDRVFAETLARARETGLEAHVLETLEDLDTPADLVRFIARRVGAASASGRHTEAALRALGLLPPAG